MYNEKDIIAQWNADMYDLNETYTDDVEFALTLMGASPKKILEIACGSGRLLVPVAKAGHDVTGLDFDEYMLDKIPAKISGAQKIQWRKADVINEEWGTGFDVVLLAANFLFNIVSDMDYEHAQELMIKKASDAVVSGGHVLIDYSHTFHPEQWFQNPEPNVIWQGTDSEGNFGKMVLLNSTYDTNTGIAQSIRRFEMTLADGNHFVQEFPVKKHFASLNQVHTWLEHAGFVIENEWGDYYQDNEYIQ